MIKVLIKADNNSEWDTSSHFLLDINKEEISKIQEMQNKLFQHFKKNISINYYNDINGRFIDIEEDDYPEYFEQEMYKIDDFENYKTPEGRPRFSYTLISKNYISFIGYGKNDNNEYYTYEVAIEDLKKLI